MPCPRIAPHSWRPSPLFTREQLSRLLAFSVASLCLLQPGSFAGGEDTVRLTIGTYNVEYFCDRHDDPYTDDEKLGPKSEEAMAAVAKTIRSIDVDFLALQEIENQGVLVDFNHQFLGNLDYRHQWVNQRSGQKTAINLAFLSRVPVRDVTVYAFDRFTLPGAQRDWTFARDLVRVFLEPSPGVTVTVFILHLKAQSRAESGSPDPLSVQWRLAEARQVRAKVAALLKSDPAAYVAVIGDVNDVRESPTYGVLTRLEDGAELIDVHATLPRADRKTMLRQTGDQLVDPKHPVDYIFASPGLAKTLVSKSVNTPVPLDPRASDHIPLIAAFDLASRK